MRDTWTRRQFLRASLGVSMATVSGAGCRTGPAASPEAPNVLFIMVDDLNDWVGCLGGHPDARTPNIDRLAASGTLFSRAYASSTLCNPSRSSLLSGLLPSTTGAYRNDVPWREALGDTITIGGEFMARGYEAIGGSKIFHDSTRPAVLRFVPSFPWVLLRPFFEDNKGPWDDYFFKRAEPRPAVLPANGIHWESRMRGSFDWGPVDVPDEQMPDFLLAEWAARQVAHERSRPFFLACGFERPHLPWYVPRKYFEMFEGRGVSLPRVVPGDLGDVPAIARQRVARLDVSPMIRNEEIWRSAVVGYLASMSFVDRCIGRLIEALDAGPNARRTVVVLLSDHGFHLGEKGHWRKATLWEEAARVPLLVRAPGITSPGTVCGRTVSLVDLYPTLMDLCGLPVRAALDGRSLAPLLEDPRQPWDRPALTTYLAGNHSIRTERWRYTRYENGSEELYDHERDPGEHVNLAGFPRFAGIKRELSAWLPEAPPG